MAVISKSRMQVRQTYDRPVIFAINLFVLIVTLCSNCYGAHLVSGSRKLENGDLSGRLHVTGRYLIFWCRVHPDDTSSGDIKEARKALGHTFVTLGHNPSLTIYNSTWRETFVFERTTWNKDEGEWRLFLPRSSFSFSDDYCEQWMVTVQLDLNTNLLGHASSLLDFHRVPILKATFGPVLSDSSSTRSEVGLFESCQLGQSACSPDVLVALCHAESNDVYLGVTHGAFGPESTSWTSVDLCRNISGCSNVTIFDVKLSTTHILILSSDGLLSANLTSGEAQVEFVHVPLMSRTWSEWTLSSTPYCSASNKGSHWTEDLVFLSPKPGQENVSITETAFWSVPPYDQWRSLNHMDPGEMVQFVAYDWHRRNLLTLSRHEDGTLALKVHPVSILTSIAPLSMASLVPHAPLPSEFLPTGFCFHPRTNFFYMFGNQIWMSTDGGATLNCLYHLGSGESVVSCHPSKVWIAFLTSAGNILFTHAGHNRVLHLDSIPPTSTLAVDALGLLLEVVRSQYWLSTNTLDIETELENLMSPLRGVFSVLPIGPLEAIVFEHSGTQLKSTRGSLLRHQGSGGTLFIRGPLRYAEDDGRSRGETQARASMIDPLRVEHKPLCELEIRNMSPTKCKLTLQCPDNSTKAWSQEDAGKTVNILLGSPVSSILLLTVQNDSDAVGLINAPSLSPDTSGQVWPVLASSDWELLDTRSYDQMIIPADALTVNKTAWEAILPPLSEFEFLPSHEGFLIVTPTGEAVVEEVVSERLVVVSVEVGDISDVLHPGEWALINSSQEPLWYFQEDACRHSLHLDEGAQRHSVRYLDLGGSFTFRAVASSMDDGPSVTEKLLAVTLSNPNILALVTKTHYDQFGSEVMDITVTNSIHEKGTTTLTVSIPAASLRCTEMSLTLTFHTTCPPSKHLHYIYTPLFTDEVFLYENPVDDLNRPLIMDLETNYRPPSTRGTDIPTSENIYNADPNASRPREKYDISKDTGHFKQCAGKSNRAECGCTVDQKLSSLAVNSDCRQRVHRLIHAGKVTLSFIIRETEMADIPVREPLALTLTEINDRIDFIVSAPSTPSLDLLEPLAIEDSTLWNSTAIQLTLIGSGLYHFRAKVASGFSYCDLQDEFQYYVDLAPLVNPTPTIVISAVSLIMGGVFFIWYLQYLSLHPQPPRRLDGTQCPVGGSH